MKAILLVRVSTTVQELDEQEKELYQLAIKEGYADEDIIPICEKESGIKLSEEERLGLNRLKEVVDTEQVKDVYIWEVSRLARTKKVLFSMQDYFISRKIQVTFKEPTYFKLLNNDGSINESADLIFTIYAQMAETEMRTKKARFRRGKQRNAEEGRFSGGYTPMYGYKIVNGKYEIDEEQAAVVRLVYDLYIKLPLGCTKLKEELAARGYEFNLYFLEYMIRNESYTGSRLQKVSGFVRKYPPIISKETWEKVVAKREQNTIGSKYKGRRYDLGASLFRCPECGCHFSVSRAGKAALYGCYRHTIAFKKNPNNYCSYSLHIRTYVLDYLLWMVAKRKKIETLFLNNEESKEAIQKDINDLVERINGYNRVGSTLKNKKDRVADLYIDGNLTKANYEKKLAAINASLEENERTINTLRDRIKILQNKVNASTIEDLEEYVKNIDKVPQKEKYDIVHELITNVTIDIDESYGSDVKVIKIYTGEEYNTFIYYPHAHKVKLEIYNADGTRSPLVTNGEVPRL